MTTTTTTTPENALLEKERAALDEARRVETERSSRRTAQLATLDERQKRVFELIDTEADHCRFLDQTYMFFVAPLRQQRVLSDAELEQLFPRIAELKAASSDLVRAFAAAGDAVYDTVGALFVATFDEVAQAAVASAVGSQTDAAAALQDLLRSNERFGKHCAAARSNALTAANDVASLQIKPFQRATKYPLLLRCVGAWF